MNNEKQQEMKEEVLDDNSIQIIIPQCCRENWDTCPHVAKKVKVKKTNVGM